MSPECELIEWLVEVRHQMRLAKQWELADAIRADLAKMGIVLEDR